MKKFDDLFEQITSVESLFSAWQTFRAGKRGRKDVAEFEWNLERNILDLHRDLAEKTYRHGGYSSFYITDPKLRHIHKASVRDRILHHAMFQVLNPIFEPTFISTSFSCRISKGTHKGVTAVEQMARKVSRNNTGRCFALKCDVRKFFDSIDHARLLEILFDRIIDTDTRWLLTNVIESYISEQSTLFERRGLPIGNLTSQLFANVYMNAFDQFMKRELRIKHYARYTDDFIIMSDDKNYLLSLLPRIQKELCDSLKLLLHPKKIELRKLHQGIDFLGYIIRPHHRTIRTRTRRRMQSKLRHKLNEYEQGSIKSEALKQTLDSYLGVLSHADAHHLSEQISNDVLLRIRKRI